LVGSTDEYDRFGQLDRFVRDVINLYKNGDRSKLYSLAKYKSWDDAYYQNVNNRAFRHISKMLESNYSEKDWREASRNYKKGASGSFHTLGKLQDSKNHEFESVMIAPAIIEQVHATHNASNTKDRKKMLLKLTSQLYLGTTRTKKNLSVPVEIREFIEDLD